MTREDGKGKWGGASASWKSLLLGDGKEIPVDRGEGTMYNTLVWFRDGQEQVRDMPRHEQETT